MFCNTSQQLYLFLLLMLQYTQSVLLVWTLQYFWTVVVLVGSSTSPSGHPYLPEHEVHPLLRTDGSELADVNLAAEMTAGLRLLLSYPTKAGISVGWAWWLGAEAAGRSSCLCQSRGSSPTATAPSLFHVLLQYTTRLESSPKCMCWHGEMDQCRFSTVWLQRGAIKNSSRIMATRLHCFGMGWHVHYCMLWTWCQGTLYLVPWCGMKFVLLLKTFYIVLWFVM